MNISFVIPAYNEEHYIGSCIDAILAEIAGRKGFEIVVVDNNSTDRTVEIVSRYSNVTLIHEKRKGANSARQTGFGASKGDLVAFIDADTQMPRGWVARAEKEFAKHPDLVCLSGPFIYYDLPKSIRALVKAFYVISYGVYFMNNFILRKTSVVQGGNEIVRRSALEKIGGHNVNLTFYGDDADLAKRLRKVGEVKFSFRFPIRSSGRRLAREGTFTMGLRYGLNYFWVMLFNKPFTMTAKEIRLADNERTYEPENKSKEWMIAVGVAVTTIVVTGGMAYFIYWALH